MTGENIFPCPVYEIPGYYRDFISRLIESRLQFYASQIFELLEMETQHQFLEALEKTIATLRLADIPVEHHIQPVYADLHGKIITDYKVTPLAFGLIGMHADPANMHIAKFKIELIKSFLRTEKL
jgi:hypothetical protein